MKRSTKDLSNIPPGTTVCSVCGVEKDNIEFSFYKARHTADGYRLMTNTNCASCSSMRSKERADIRKKFAHIKAPEFGELCELCQEPVYRNWQLDHCHQTGEFRGWLCKSCNTGLGGIGDSTEGVLLALEYLEKASKKENLSQQRLLG